MDDDLSCCCGCILVIFLIFAGVSALSHIHWTSDNYDANDIYVDRFDSGISHYYSNGDKNNYMYHVFYDLTNVSTSFEDSEVVTYFYSGDEIQLSDEITYFSNNTTEILTYDNLKEYNTAYISAFLHSDNLTNITHVKICIIKDGKIIFNTTKKFNMSNLEEDVSDNDFNNDSLGLNGLDDNDTLSSSDGAERSSGGGTYVGSVNSDKFHEPSCSQANRIKEGNRITFSSRDDAISSGYSPCGICHP